MTDERSFHRYRECRRDNSPIELEINGVESRRHTNGKYGRFRLITGVVQVSYILAATVKSFSSRGLLFVGHSTSVLRCSGAEVQMESYLASSVEPGNQRNCNGKSKVDGHGKLRIESIEVFCTYIHGMKKDQPQDQQCDL